jgi:circadian clock protein KaiC
VTKFRGSESAAGRHTFRIHDGQGGVVYPKLVPGDHFRERTRDQCPSDIEALDKLLHGGIERGSVTVVSGPSGVGKTTTGTHFLQAAANRGEHALAFLFEELRSDYLHRCSQLGMDVEQLAAAGLLEIQEVESLTQSPDEFAHRVRDAVEEREVEFVMIDGVAGYRLGLRGDDSAEQLTRELHALCRYLKRMGVTVILIEEVRSVTGEFTPTDQQTSYLADNILFLRYLEVEGEIEKAIGVLKKRFGDFEKSLRKLAIDSEGLHVGDQLTGYQGLLTGTPERAHDPSEP